MTCPKVHILFLFLFILSFFDGFSQSDPVRVEFSDPLLEPTDRFTITVKIRGENYDVQGFPVIEGFTKGSVATSHTPYREGRQRGIEHHLIQSYQPQKLGSFRVPNFTLTINGEPRSISGTRLQVVKDRNNPTLLPAEAPPAKEKPAREDARLGLSTSASSAYVGEGIQVSLAFYVSDINTAGWDFPTDLSAQVENLVQKIKPANCLENRLPITDVTPQKVEIDGRGYTRYTLYSATYYPLDNRPIPLPAVALPMWLLDSRGRRTAQRTFSTEPQQIAVRSLPEHPLMNRVAVGKFSLKEKLPQRQTTTGTSIVYTFKIIGTGNFTTVTIPKPNNTSLADFFPAKVITRVPEGRENGEKQFDFSIFLKEAGTLSLRDYFQFIYFNTETATYDTLRPVQTLTITGQRVAASTVAEEDIYAIIEKLDSSVIETDYRKIVTVLSNIIIMGMMTTIVYFILRNWRLRRKGP